MSSNVKPVLFVTIKPINLNVGVRNVPVLGEPTESRKKTSAIAHKVVPQQQPAIPSESTLPSKSLTVQTDRVKGSELEKENRKPRTGPNLSKTRSDVFSRDCLLQVQTARRIEDEKDKKSKSGKVDKVFKEHSERNELTLPKDPASRSRSWRFDSPEATSEIVSRISQGRIKYYKGRKVPKTLPY